MALIQDDIWPIIFQDDTACGSIDYAHSVALRSAPIASCFLELEKVNQDLESRLRDDFRSILDSMDALIISSSPRSPSPPPNPPTRTSPSVLNASFAISAYSWLLENVANPYPSSTVKASFAKQHDCSLSAINSWFINARRRIGWTALCRDYFSNCRADALDAAHRALVDEDPSRPLPPDVIHAFVRVKVAADDIYSSAFAKRALSDGLDSIVKDVTDLDATSEDGRKDCKTKEAVVSSKALETGLQDKAQYHYPSSDCSSSSSPMPPLVASLTDDSEEDEDVSPPILAGRKRRLSYSEPTYSTMSLPTKRRRYLCASSPDESSVSSSQKPLERIQSSCVSPTVQGSTRTSARKRRLSDTDAGIPKCPEGSIAGPPIHGVSDPLPLSTLESDQAFDEWFKSNFDDLFSLPPPAAVVEPDLSSQWEVELFNNYSIPQELPRRPFESLDSSTEDQGTTSADLFALDELLQSLERGGFVVPSNVMDPALTASSVNSVPQDLLSSEPIDWTALLNTQTYEPALDPIFDQFHTGSLPLPEIGLPILQLPEMLSSVVSMR